MRAKPASDVPLLLMGLTLAGFDPSLVPLLKAARQGDMLARKRLENRLRQTGRGFLVARIDEVLDQEN